MLEWPSKYLVALIKIFYLEQIVNIFLDKMVCLNSGMCSGNMLRQTKVY